MGKGTRGARVKLARGQGDTGTWGQGERQSAWGKWLMGVRLRGMGFGRFIIYGINLH